MTNIKFFKSVILRFTLLLGLFYLVVKAVRIYSSYIISSDIGSIIFGVSNIVASLFLFIIICEYHFQKIQWQNKVRKFDNKKEKN